MESGGDNLQANSGGDGDIFCDNCDIGSPVFHFNHPVPCRRHQGDARHLTSPKLGKRQYYEEGRASDPLKGMKRERLSRATARTSCSSPSSSPATAMVPPRCQVEGCNVALVDAKDYHRRHKVCQIHSKAPNVIVLGVEQRFCQQCSRFHVISEFDESKRSCRRRLAGHNERRRKNSGESFIRNPSPIDGAAAASRALPLLSPASSSPSVWASTDLSSQSSAALRELIAENRAAILAGQLLSGGPVFPLAAYHPPPLAAPPQVGEDVWDHLRGPTDGHVTLDLMQTARSKSRDEDEECCDLWRSLEETHVV